MKTVRAVAVLLMLGCPLFAQDVDSLAGKRVVFLGDSITQAGGYVTFASYYLAKLYPQKTFDTVCNWRMSPRRDEHSVHGLCPPD